MHPSGINKDETLQHNLFADYMKYYQTNASSRKWKFSSEYQYVVTFLHWLTAGDSKQALSGLKKGNKTNHKTAKRIHRVMIIRFFIFYFLKRAMKLFACQSVLKLEPQLFPKVGLSLASQLRTHSARGWMRSALGKRATWTSIYHFPKADSTTMTILRANSIKWLRLGEKNINKVTCVSKYAE